MPMTYVFSPLTLFVLGAIISILNPLSLTTAPQQKTATQRCVRTRQNQMGGQELGNFFDLAKKGDGAKAGVDLSIFAQGLQETEFKSRAAARQPDGRDGQGDRLMGGQRPESDRISGTLNAMDIDGSHKQMVVVHSNSWGSANGSLELYERNPSGDGWHSTGQHWDVSLGMTGMGWGRGVLSGDVDPGPGKME